MNTQSLIAAIEAFSALRGLSPATVTGRAVGNSRLYGRMKAGGGCTLATAERLVGYMGAVGAIGAISPEIQQSNADHPAPMPGAGQPVHLAVNGERT